MATRARAFGPPGDPARHLTLDRLESRWHVLPAAPRDAGDVALLVRRRPDKTRETPGRIALSPGGGLPGDAWRGDPDAALTVMRVDVAELIANGQSLTVFGDNLFVTLDLSGPNLPAGTRVRLGSALVEVTAKPHDGCRKFAARFGRDALRFVSSPELRPRNLRGIYVRVVEGGDVGVGDAVEVVSRPSPAVAKAEPAR